MPGLPISPPFHFRESTLTLALALAVAGGGCTGGGGGSGGKTGPGDGPVPNQAGPVVDAGPEFAIASSRLEARIFSMRPGEPLPPEAVRWIKAQGETLPEPFRAALAQRGFMGALMNADGLVTLEHILTAKPAEAPAPPPRPAPKPVVSTPDGSGVSSIDGAPPPASPPVEVVVTPAPRGSAVGDIATVTVRPGPSWERLTDAPAREEAWALALGTSVAPLKPGVLRCYVRAWPAPAEPVPTAGMAADMRVQFAPVVVGPAHEPYRDPLSPPPLSNDLSARGNVLGRQAFTTSLRGDRSLVLIALPVIESGSGPGPAVEAAPLLGQALLGPGPTVAGGKAAGPRVLVLKAVVPGTYRLMLDRPAPAPGSTNTQ